MKMFAGDRTSRLNFSPRCTRANAVFPSALLVGVENASAASTGTSVSVRAPSRSALSTSQ